MPNNNNNKKSIFAQHVTYITVIYITYVNIFTDAEFFNLFSETSYALFYIIKGVLLMMMGNWFLMHLRQSSCLTMDFRKLMHPLVL